MQNYLIRKLLFVCHIMEMELFHSYYIISKGSLLQRNHVMSPLSTVEMKRSNCAGILIDGALVVVKLVINLMALSLETPPAKLTLVLTTEDYNGKIIANIFFRTEQLVIFWVVTFVVIFFYCTYVRSFLHFFVKTENVYACGWII